MIFPAFLLGLMGSLHCLGMCGPIAFMLPVDRKNHLKGGAQVSAYHLGRILAYTAVGMLFGLLGSGLYLFGFQQKLSIGIGLLMILSVLFPKRISIGQRLMKPISRGISGIKARLSKELSRKSPDAFLSIGFLNGLLPCGLVYMAALGSIALGNPARGSLFMAAFGLGTLPLMTAGVYLGNFAKSGLRQHIRRLIPAIVILVGILFIIRGLGLGIPYLSPAVMPNLLGATLDCQP